MTERVALHRASDPPPPPVDLGDEHRVDLFAILADVLGAACQAALRQLTKHLGDLDHWIDRQAITAICPVMLTDVMQHLIPKTSGKEAWDTLKTLHLGYSGVP